MVGGGGWVGGGWWVGGWVGGWVRKQKGLLPLSPLRGDSHSPEENKRQPAEGQAHTVLTKQLGQHTYPNISRGHQPDQGGKTKQPQMSLATSPGRNETMPCFFTGSCLPQHCCQHLLSMWHSEHTALSCTQQQLRCSTRRQLTTEARCLKPPQSCVHWKGWPEPV